MIENPDTINNLVFQERCICSDSFINNCQRIMSKNLNSRYWDNDLTNQMFEILPEFFNKAWYK